MSDVWKWEDEDADVAGVDPDMWTWKGDPDGARLMNVRMPDGRWSDWSDFLRVAQGKRIPYWVERIGLHRRIRESRESRQSRRKLIRWEVQAFPNRLHKMLPNADAGAVLEAALSPKARRGGAFQVGRERFRLDVSGERLVVIPMERAYLVESPDQTPELEATVQMRELITYFDELSPIGSKAGAEWTVLGDRVRGIADGLDQLVDVRAGIDLVVTKVLDAEDRAAAAHGAVLRRDYLR